MSRGNDFWSRRKAAVRAEESAPDPGVPPTAENEALPQDADQRPDAELLAEAGLDAPETCNDAAELRAYLKTDLPQRIKTRALRRMWRLNPVLANLDGLVDYGADYTDAATVVDNLQTVYRVGRGMADRIAELRAQRDARDPEGAACGDPEDDAAPQSDITAEHAKKVERIETDGHSSDINPTDSIVRTPGHGSGLEVSEEDLHQVEPVTSRTRRMRFRFDEREL